MLFSAAKESKLDSTMGNQKHRNNGISTTETARALARCSAERKRKGRDRARMDNGTSGALPNGSNAMKLITSQLAHSVCSRLKISCIDQAPLSFCATRR